MHLEKSKIIINPNEVKKVVGDYDLKVYKNIWHYSFNEMFWKNTFELNKTENGDIFLYSESHNQFSPLLVYTNNLVDVRILKNNNLLDAYNIHDESKRNIYWFLRINSFKDFLERRSKTSSKPKKHFPSLESYEKIRSKINSDILIQPLDKKYLYENYDKLKLEEHMTGEQLYNLFNKNNPDFNFEWMKTVSVIYENEITAIAIIIDDGKSINLENIAAKRDSLGFGIYLCTELVKYCSENNYFSFDAGVSGIYGNYKQKIFLDSFEVYKVPERNIGYFHFWKPGYLNKVKSKILNSK